MTHRMTNDEIQQAYKAQGGEPIVHELNDSNRPATTKELLEVAAFVGALFVVILAIAAVIWLVF